MSQRLFWSLTLAALLVGCAQEKPPEQPAEPPEAASQATPTTLTITPEVQRAIGLATAPVERKAVPMRQDVPGQVAARPEAESVVHAPIAGRIVSLHATIGDRVAKGALLAILESAELGAAQAAYLKAAGAERLAEREYARVQKLFAAELSSRKELDASAAEREAARVARAEAAQQLRVYGATDADLAALVRRGRVETRQAVRAPAAGTVVERDAALGDRARPDAEAPMFRLLDLTTVRVEADLPERDFLAVKPGQSAAIALESLAGKALSGRVVQLAPILDAQTRTGKAMVDVPNPQGLLRPGMSCRVRIETGRRDALMIPASAVQLEEGKAYAYVKEGAETFREAHLTLGPQIADAFEVKSGVAAGATVVTKGSFDLRAQARKAQFGGE